METEREQIVMECIRMMYSSVDTDTAIMNTLEKLGGHFGAERAYVFRVRSRHRRWMPHFCDNECVVIQDLESIKETSPEEYAILMPQDIKSLVAFPLQEKGKLAGYFGMDNPDMESLGEISNIRIHRQHDRGI